MFPEHSSLVGYAVGEKRASPMNCRILLQNDEIYGAGLRESSGEIHRKARAVVTPPDKTCSSEASKQRLGVVQTRDIWSL